MFQNIVSAESLSQVAPIQHHRQHSTHQLMNRIPYKVISHGEKLHLDQNERFIKYEMTHGYSCKIVGFFTLPVKKCRSNICLFWPLLLKEGLWVQVGFDHGREFSLMLSVQQGLAGFRVREDRAPLLQTVSRENHLAERVSSEVNQRINNIIFIHWSIC